MRRANWRVIDGRDLALASRERDDYVRMVAVMAFSQEADSAV